jgi:arylsulfatase A-like enzyme
MTRSKAADKPFYIYLPYTQIHIPPIPDPQYAGKTKRGNWADILTQMDDFTGVIPDKLDELGITDDTIVVWASDNGADTTYRFPAIDPDPAGGQWRGFSGPCGAGYSPRWRAPTGRRAWSAGPGRCLPAGSATNSCTRSTSSRRW